ncbi:helix-turn-helix transcriptional regulator [Dawidia soli]
MKHRMENGKLKKITTTDRPSGWMDLPAYKQENRAWMKRSADISLRVLDVLDEKKMTQTELAQLMNVSRQYVSRILRGSENLTLETISKLEDVLDVTLINIVEEEPTATVNVEQKT